MNQVVDVDLEKLAEIRERYGAAEFDVFGSGARGDARPDSDIDLRYVVRPDAELDFRFDDLNDELDDVFGRHVGLVSKCVLNPRPRATVLSRSHPVHLAA